MATENDRLPLLLTRVCLHQFAAYIIDHYRVVGLKPIQTEGAISIAYVALSFVGLDIIYAGSRPVAHGDTLYVGHLVFHGACVVGQRNGSCAILDNGFLV